MVDDGRMSESRKWNVLKTIGGGSPFADETDWAGTNTVPTTALTESGAPFKRARSAEDSETIEVLVLGLDVNGVLVNRGGASTITMRPFEVLEGKHIHGEVKPFTESTAVDIPDIFTTVLNRHEAIRMRGSPRWGLQHSSVTVPAAIETLVFLWRPR